MVFAKTSETKFIALMPFMVCFGSILKPPIMFDAISAVVAKSVAPAVARESSPGIADIVCLALKPAIAKNCIPSATCPADHSVVAPSLSAV